MSERESLFSLVRLRRRNASVEIGYIDKTFGEEIVWCGEQNGEYVGWTPKESALARGYEPHRTDSDPAVAALIDAVEAAYDYRFGIGPNPKAKLDKALTAFDWQEVKAERGY